MLTGRGEARRGKRLAGHHEPIILQFLPFSGWTGPYFFTGLELWSVLPHLSVSVCFLAWAYLELWRERGWCRKGYTYLPYCSGLFVFFFCGLHSCLLSLSLSFSPPPPVPLPLVFFREGKTLLSSRLELLSSAYLAILLFSSSSHHHHHSSFIMGILEKIV